MLDSGMPESFSVLIHELRGLCLDTQLLGGNIEKLKKEAAASKLIEAPVSGPESDDDLLAGALNI